VDQGTVDRKLNEGGVTSVQFLLAAAMALVLFLALANLVVVQYGRGAIRSALEQGARAGAVSGSVLDCESKAMSVVGQLLGGRMSDRLTVGCFVEVDRVVAEGSAVFQSWTILAPDFTVSMTSEAFLEPVP
jgi:hypothetical protein